jgi:ribosomal protein S18 acetylase RimI-like enzyme
MEREFFNYSTHIADSRWSRRSFIRQWWRIYANDSRWAPPPLTGLQRALEPGRWPHLDRQQPLAIHLEAVERRQTNQSTMTAGLSSPGILGEQVVCAGVVLTDPRRRERIGTLALFRFINEVDVLERFLWTLMERTHHLGIRRLVGPTALSPWLSQGILLDHFHLPPPLHTPYNPPYAPEVIGNVMEVVGESSLFTFHVDSPSSTTGRDTGSDDDLRCAKLEADALHEVLGPLLEAALGDDSEFPPPDAAESAFMLDWLCRWPVEAWIVRKGEEPAGFVLLQPDLAPAMTRAQGGRNPLWRGWLKWRMGRPVSDGRIVLGGVHPEWRRQGIGRRLWRQALVTAAANGWQTLTIGPVADDSPGARFLHAMGATPQQRYALFAADL